MKRRGEAGDEGAARTLPLVAAAALAVIRPHAMRPWDELVAGASGARVGGGGGAMSMGGYTGGYDPSMARWFKEILGAEGGGDAAGASGGGGGGRAAAATKLDNRLVTPGLRTLDVLLAAGALTGCSAGWGLDVLASARRRAQNAREDAVRIMAAGAVALGLLGAGEPVRTTAAVLLLDLLGHTFPRVRKVTAEALYVKAMTVGDALLPPGAPAPASLDGALSLLTATAWDADLPAVLVARDALYPLLAVAMPAARSGADPAIFGAKPSAGGGGGKGGAAGDGEDDGSYGALVREMGY